MYIAIGDLLENGILPDLEVLFAPAGFQHFPVSLTSTQSIYELPVDNFIKEHELVFCSSIGMVEEEAAYCEFITQMRQAGASAIVMAFQHGDYRPSARLLAHAEAQQMPLFLIPWEQRFLEIQMNITAKIRASRERAFAQLQTALFNLYFDEKTLKDAADAIEDSLDAAVQIVNLNKKVLAESKGFSQTGLPKEVAIALNEIPVGSLLLFTQQADKLPDVEILNRYIGFPLAMWFLHKSVEERTIARLKNDFIWNLANDRNVSCEERLYQSRQLNLDLSCGYTCLLLGLQQDEAKEGRIYARSSTHTFAERVLEETADHMGLKLMYSSYSSDIILYLEHRREPVGALERFVETVQEKLNGQNPKGKVFWGVSESAEGPVDFAKLYKHATQALSYARHSKKCSYYFSYHDTKEAHITSLLAEDQSLYEEAVAIIGRLNDYSDMDLFGTLCAYIGCNYNVSLTARQLYIHRQSLLYRLGKIEELTGMSLHSHRDLFLLEIYVRIYSGY